MRYVRSVAPFAVTLAVVAATTAVLLYFKLAGAGPHHPIFMYLLPIGLIAFLFGSMPATLFAVVAIFCSAFFLYDPVYSFRVANPREFGDLICFMILALMTVKCVSPRVAVLSSSCATAFRPTPIRINTQVASVIGQLQLP